MKYAIILALALGCAHLQAAAVTLGTCGIEAAQQQSMSSALPLILQRDDYETQLGSLATVYGLSVVNCVINAWLAGQPSATAAASDSLEEVARARAWLAKHPATT